MKLIRFVMFPLVVLAFVSCAPLNTQTKPSSAGGADPPSTGTLRGDAKLIITSDKNDVRLWDRPPRVLILSTDDRVETMMAAIREKIEGAVRSPFGGPFFSSWTYRKLTGPPELEAAPNYFYVAKDDELVAQIKLAYPKGVDEHYDIVVLVGDRLTMSLYNSLWGLDARASRRMAAGRQLSCHYSVISKHGVRLGAYAAVLATETDAILQACLWEEFLHTLGPLTDAKGTPYFSFNDNADDEGLQENDLLLIRALYESGAKPGDPPDKALDYLEQLFATQ